MQMKLCSIAGVLVLMIAGCGTAGPTTNQTAPSYNGSGTPQSQGSQNQGSQNQGSQNQGSQNTGDCQAPTFTPTADTAAAENWCVSASATLCSRMTDCPDAVANYFGTTFPDIATCESTTAANCADQLQAGDWDGERANADFVAACNNVIQNATCDDIANTAPDNLPFECNEAVQPVPEGDASGCTVITPGTYNGTIDPNGTVTWNSKSAQKYCVCVNAGQTLTITTSGGTDPSTDLVDSQLTLVDPNGNHLAFDDDTPDGNLYAQLTFDTITSGSYLIVVTPFDNTYSGAFSITVAAQ